MKIIRGRLNPADVSNPSFRYDATCDCIQQTPDNGTTWVNVPSADPRHSVGFLKPPVAGSNKQCDSAANMVKWLKDFIDYETALMVAGATITTLVNGILTPMDLLFPAADFLSVIIDIADTLFGIGATALTAAFTSTEYDALLCIFFCNADGEGRVSAAQLATIEELITEQLNTTAALVVNAILFLQGEIGLSNAGAIGSQVGDCTACACGWSREWNGANMPAWEFFPSSNFTGGARGHFSSGEFLSDDSSVVSWSTEIMMRIVLEATGNFRRIEINYTRTIGDFGAAPSQQDTMIFDSSNGYYDGTTLAHQNSTVNQPSGAQFIWSGDQDIGTELTFWMFAALSASLSTYGSIAIQSIKMRGDGDDPFV